MKKKTKKKLVKGKDWHGWAWKDKDGLDYRLELTKLPDHLSLTGCPGKWVKVKLVEVK